MQQLRAHIEGRAHLGVGLDGLGAENAPQTQVPDLHGTVGGYEYICRLQITVHYAFFVPIFGMGVGGRG